MSEPAPSTTPDRAALSRRRLGRLLGLAVPVTVVGAATAGPADARVAPASWASAPRRTPP